MAKDSPAVESGMNTTQLLYSLLLIAVFLLGYLLARVQNMEQPNTGVAAVGNPQVAGAQGTPPPVKADVDEGHLPVLGDKNAKVTIVEFSDFQCPFCERFYNDAYQQLKKEYIDTGKAKLYFRHYPLSFHQAAEPAGIASECANEQGKFWEYHDKVFSEQAQISAGTLDENKNTLKQFAADLGLDTAKFNQCLDSEKYKDAVAKDMSDGTAAGTSGTPTFYVNGNQLVGAQPFSAFKAIIDQELSK